MKYIIKDWRGIVLPISFSTKDEANAWLYDNASDEFRYIFYFVEKVQS